MKIKDYEKQLSLCFHFSKSQNINDIKSCINDYSESQDFCFSVFKKGDFVFFIKTNDGIHYGGAGIIAGESTELISVMQNYLVSEKAIHGILLKDFENFLIKCGFEKIEQNTLSERIKQKILDDLSFKINNITENEIYNDEFYAIYIFDELIGSSSVQINTGFCKNFVIIGSDDGENISSYYPMTNGKLTDGEYNKFYNATKIDKI